MQLQFTVDLDKLLQTPVDEMTDQQVQNVTDQLPPNSEPTQPLEKLPDNAVVLPKDESGIDPGQNSTPLKYMVVDGDTIKKIAEKFAVSYGELSNYILNKTGTTSIRAGDEILIPRHFIDLSSA